MQNGKHAGTPRAPAYGVLLQPWLPPAAALLLVLPALWGGWQFDDHIQRALLRPSAGLDQLRRALAALFTFMDGDAGRARRLMEQGVYPWWTLPEGKVAFFRPLAGLTHWLDYLLWPESPLLMHLHSLIWYLALSCAVVVLYRRLDGPTPLAALAALLYVADDARGLPAGWIANRNALCATLFGVLALLMHDRWRRAGSRRAAWLAPLWLALGLLSAEAALAAVGYLLAYALALDRGAPSARLLSLGPTLLVVVLWRLGYRALGYGAWGTSYVDPLLEPLRYLAALAGRAPLLLLGQWTPFPAELAPLLPPPAARLAWLGGVLVATGSMAMIYRLARRDATARFWGLGMLLSLPPACSSLPGNRLLLCVGLGGMALLARLLLAPAAPGTARGSGVRRSLIAALVVCHLVLAPLALPLSATSLALLGDVEPPLRALADAPGDDLLVVVAAPSFFHVGALPLIQQAEGAPPTASLLLSSGLGPVALSRPDARTLVVRPAQGFILGFEAVFRGNGHPLRLGERVELGHVAVEVTALTSDGRPAEAAFRFPSPLEAPRRRWLTWRDGRYEPVTLPGPGETTVLQPGTLW